MVESFALTYRTSANKLLRAVRFLDKEGDVVATIGDFRCARAFTVVVDRSSVQTRCPFTHPFSISKNFKKKIGMINLSG